MSKLQKLRNKLAERLRAAAFRLDGQPLVRPEDVENSINAHFEAQSAQEAQQNKQHAYAHYCAQNRAGELGFWVPRRGSGSPN